jgi:hypothetical protein
MAQANLEELMDEPTRSVRGAQALVDAVRSEALEEFPMDHEGIDYAFGDLEVEDGTGGYVAVRDLTDHLKASRYDTADDLLRGLREALADWKGVDLPLDQMSRPEDQVDRSAASA